MILLFLHVLFSRYHNKTNPLLFYLFLIFRDLNRLVYSQIFVFVSFLWLKHFAQNIMMYEIMNLDTSFISPCFLTFSVVIAKTTYFIMLKTFLSKSVFVLVLSYVFISMYVSTNLFDYI